MSNQSDQTFQTIPPQVLLERVGEMPRLPAIRRGCGWSVGSRRAEVANPICLPPQRTKPHSLSNPFDRVCYGYGGSIFPCFGAGRDQSYWAIPSSLAWYWTICLRVS